MTLEHADLPTAFLHAKRKGHGLLKINIGFDVLTPSEAILLVRFE